MNSNIKNARIRDHKIEKDRIDTENLLKLCNQFTQSVMNIQSLCLKVQLELISGTLISLIKE